MTDSPPSPIRPTPAGSSERPPFELGGLLAPLLENGHQEDAKEVLEIYLEEHLKRSEVLHDAVGAGDFMACRPVLHAMIGSAGGIGADDLSKALAALQTACRDRDADGLILKHPSHQLRRRFGRYRRRTERGQPDC